MKQETKEGWEKGQVKRTIIKNGWRNGIIKRMSEQEPLPVEEKK